MSVLSRIAFYQERRDEVPNQELAHELASTKNTEGIMEIAEHLWDKNTDIRSDCLKVVYEIGYIDPELIAPYVEDFLKLLISKQNRLVWGAMIALTTIASQNAPKLFEKRTKIIKAMDQGSVITIDNGIKVLAAVAAFNVEFQKELFPYLREHLRKCRTKEVPQHAESILVCVNETNKEEFLSVLRQRLPDMIPSQAVRIRKILKQFA
ncbi:MAG: hypothetical protein FD147_984 [Chloroflexi bacterium]|nr:MAG: hypothetical protein FD147_984 [Chloroflexota bacterium]MBA4375401.1 hypothetical protein [Anaerolinea sp.]